MKLNFARSIKGVVLTLALLMAGNLLVAQQSISGKVTDAGTGEPLIGANILVLGTSVGTVTDADGNYKLSVPENQNQIQFSYTGYQSSVINWAGQSTLDVALTAGQLIDEVVVIGYGTVRKEDATGSVIPISQESFNKGAIVSADNLIAGKVAGVQITPQAGPGQGSTIRIRGGTSVNAGNEPLFVIDGVPVDNGGFPGGRNPLNFLNPNDIETFTVLKDASATAIYGSRGANGVIIITTKAGKANSKPSITYDGYVSSASFVGEPDILGVDEFINVVTFKRPDRLNLLGDARTNWFDEVTRTAMGQSHNLSVNGGGQNIGYRISAGYQKLEGIVRPYSTERTSIAMAYDLSLLDNQLKIRSNVKGSLNNEVFDPGPIGGASSFDPTQPVFDPSNTAFAGYFEYGLALSPRNPVSLVEQINNVGRSFRSIGNIEFDYQPNFLPGLTGKLNMGYDINNSESKRFVPTTFQRPPVSNRTGEINISNGRKSNLLLDAYLNYKKDFNGGNHVVDVTAGYSYQDFSSEFPSFTAFDLDSDIFGFNSTIPATEFEAFNTVIENRLISFFGRLNYNIQGKYLFTATVRRDGSSRFSENNRWGVFPSAAFAWRILEENFASGLESIFSDLKFRASYGVTGNQEIGDFRYLPLYTLSTVRARYQFGNQFINTLRADGYDSNLKWEETASFNLGLDFGFSNGRVNGTLEYYQKTTNDLLFVVPVPAGTNLTDRVLTNIGELENKGVELTLNANLVNKPDFTWDVSLNAALNRNKILAIDRTSDKGIPTGGISGGVGNNIQILQVDEAVNAFFMFQHKLDGNGKPLVDGVDHNEDGAINLADMYEDLNKDGVVTDLDKRPIENPAPDALFGLSSTLTYKGFDLNFTLRSNLGNHVYNNNASSKGFYRNVAIREGFLENLHNSVLVTSFTDPQYFSDYYLEDASFIRMDNMTLGYTFKNLPKNRMLRLYGTVQNLFVLTEYSGLDPEIFNGIDNNLFPMSRTFLFGLSLGL